VIGSTDNLDPPASRPVPIADVTLRQLDIEGPPRGGGEGWEEAVRLARLVTVRNGRIERCKLRGGPVELIGGPWLFAENTFRGTHPGTSSWAVLSVHHPHGLNVARNHIGSEPGSGKTWRFLVLTDSGSGVRVEGNRVEGVGPRDGDTIPSANAPELILTEAYRLHYEGRAAAISPDGRVLQVSEPQGEPARTGAYVAILDGPRAGRWHRVAQAIDPRTMLVDPPIEDPASRPAVSIATGFEGTVFRDNHIDSRGGSVACNLVLVGNQYGTEVVGNRLIGGGDAFKITACPSEAPVHWGWSHNPFLGGRIESNTLADMLRPGILAVEHGAPVKSSAGRTYFGSTFRENRIEGPRPPGGDRAAVVVGAAPTADPGELRLDVSGNTYDGPAPAPLFRVEAGTINGRPVRDRAEPFPAPPPRSGP
jgi:hypothetical protein